MVIFGAADFVSAHFFLVAFEASAASGWWCMAAQQLVVVLAWNAEVASTFWNKMWHRWAAVVTTMDVKKECECCGLPAL